MVPAGTTRSLGSGFMLDIAVFDLAEPELDWELAMFPLLLLSLDVEEELESAGAAGLLQPSRAKDK